MAQRCVPRAYRHGRRDDAGESAAGKPGAEEQAGWERPCALTPQEQKEAGISGGVVVERVGGAAAQAGLQRGDIILRSTTPGEDADHCADRGEIRQTRGTAGATRQRQGLHTGRTWLIGKTLLKAAARAAFFMYEWQRLISPHAPHADRGVAASVTSQPSHVRHAG